MTFSSTDDLKKWTEDNGYTTELLCDADRSVAMAYGAAESADQEKATRVSVLVGPDGKVVKTYNVDDAPSHPDAVLADIG